MIAKIVSTGSWAEFWCQRHQKFEALTEGGIRVTVFVSRVAAADPKDQDALNRERAIRHETDKLRELLDEPERLTVNQSTSSRWWSRICRWW